MLVDDPVKNEKSTPKKLKVFWIAPSSPLKGYLLIPLNSHLPSTKRRGRSGTLVCHMLGTQQTWVQYSVHSSELFLCPLFPAQVNAVAVLFKRLYYP